MERTLALAACLILGALLGWWGEQGPRPLPASAPAEAFAAGRALADVEIIARGPHPTGTDANAAVRDHLVARLRQLGLDPQVQVARPFMSRQIGGKPYVVGARVDYETGRSFRYVPELLIGVGGRSSVAANADVAFSIPTRGFADYGTPYVRTGVGLVHYGGSDELPPTFDEEPDDGDTALTLNLGLGADLEVGGGRLFVDLTTGNFGAFNRLTAGYRFPFGRRAY